MKAATSFSLKDHLFNAEKVHYLSAQFKRASDTFPAEDFETQVMRDLPSLELKERIEHIAQCLNHHLPDDYPGALSIIIRALPKELDPGKTDDDFGDFIFAPLSHFVALYGCRAEYLELSLRALRSITKRFSAENAIRYFINAFPQETMAFLARCAKDSNYHVRRLASEGTRPKLPWAQKIHIDHRQPMAILEILHADPTRYVTRSVANHLNDIAKVDPALVIATLQSWQAQQQQETEEMAFISKHALRTLIKEGYPEALALLGFHPDPQVRVLTFETSTERVKLGENFIFDLELLSLEDQRLAIDYVIYFAGLSERQRQKVFKLKEISCQPNETIRLRKRHRMRLMTTRRLYAGEHRVCLQINGQQLAEMSFVLEV